MRYGNPVHVTASAVVRAFPAKVQGVVIGAKATGQTLKLHNCTTTGAAAGGNLIASFNLEVDNADVDMFGAYFTVGVVAIVSGGTPDITVITD